MSTPNSQVWITAEIDLISKTSPFDVLTIRVINRPPLLDTASFSDYVPILEEVTDIGNTMGQYLPQPARASIILDNSPNSFGYERKFSDLFERYSPIAQEVVIKATQLAIDDTDIEGDLTTVWTSKVVDIDIDSQPGRLVVNLANIPFIDRAVTKAVQSETGEGRYLPVVFGESIPVSPFDLSNEAGTDLAYATTFADNYVNYGVVAYYAKDRVGKWIEVESPATASTPIDYTGSFSAYYSPTYAEMATPVTVNNQIIIGGYLTLDGNGIAGTPSGAIKIKAYEDTPFGPGDSPIAEANIDKANYTAEFQASAEFEVEFRFNRPVIERDRFWLAVSETNPLASPGNVQWRMYSTGGTEFATRTYDGTEASVWNYTTGTSVAGDCGLYGVFLDDVPSPSSGDIDADGLGHSKVDVSQRSAPGGQTNPSLSNIEWKFDVKGIIDTSGGTITGVANQLLVAPYHQMFLLLMEYDGADWTGANLGGTYINAIEDWAINRTGITYRRTEGASRDRVFLSELLSEICQNAGAKLHLSNNSPKLRAYAWGEPVTATVTISDEDSQLQGIRVYGTETVVNAVVLRYQPTIPRFDASYFQQAGKYRAFGGVLHYSDGSYIDLSYGAYNADSVAKYGKRQLSIDDYYLVGDLASAENLARYLTTYFADPLVLITLDVPYFRYRQLELMDVINVVHPGLPSYFGTSSNAATPTYRGAECDPSRGQYFKRAKSYRAQIEGQTRRVSPSRFPTMRLVCRLIINEGDLT